MAFVLGVDGGASKTIALVATSDGEIVGSGRRGSSNIYDGDPDAMLANAVRACHDALAMANVPASEISTSVFSMCGADWPEDISLIESIFQAYGLGGRIRVVNDGLGGLRAGSATGPAVAVICGTGAGTAARNRDGTYWHSSFWQGIGGALDLTNLALRAVYRAYLEIDPPTMLTPAVLAFTGAESVEELLHRLTRRDRVPVATYAGLARVLLDVVSAGDATARKIATTMGAELGDYAVAAARQVDILHEPFDLVLGGGVFKHPEWLLADALIARVREVAPTCVVIRSSLDPVVGALLLAYDEAATGEMTTITAAVERSWLDHRDRVLAIPIASIDTIATSV